MPPPESDCPRRVWVQEARFDVGGLQEQLRELAGDVGAIAAFTGYVRDEPARPGLQALYLEHYPGMTEDRIDDIVGEAGRRWPIAAASVVHRVGTLPLGEAIVWVGVAATHRAAAHSACEFVMDFLKTEAPIWKQERRSGGGCWVEQRDRDVARVQRWTADEGSPSPGAGGERP